MEIGITEHGAVIRAAKHSAHHEVVVVTTRRIKTTTLPVKVGAALRQHVVATAAAGLSAHRRVVAATTRSGGTTTKAVMERKKAQRKVHPAAMLAEPKSPSVLQGVVTVTPANVRITTKAVQTEPQVPLRLPQQLPHRRQLRSRAAMPVRTRRPRSARLAVETATRRSARITTKNVELSPRLWLLRAQNSHRLAAAPVAAARHRRRPLHHRLRLLPAVRTVPSSHIALQTAATATGVRTRTTMRLAQ